MMNISLLVAFRQILFFWILRRRQGAIRAYLRALSIFYAIIIFKLANERDCTSK